MRDDATRAASADVAFRTVFHTAPEVVAFAPGRVNLIGEHTDYNGGATLPIAIDLGTTCAAARRTDGRVAVFSGQVRAPVAPADPWTFDPTDPPTWLSYVIGAVRVAGERGWWQGGVDLAIDADLPLGAGLSSSSSLECAVLTALAGLDGAPIDPWQVALAAQQVEHDWVHVPCGFSDQAAVMLSIADHALLIDHRAQQVRPVRLDLDDMGLGILLIDTHVHRRTADGGYGQRRAQCELAAGSLGVDHLCQLGLPGLDLVNRLPEPLSRRARHVVTEQVRVEHVVTALGQADPIGLAVAFAGSHDSLRRDFEVSCPELDLAVAAAVMGGAAAARMTGCGFGGNALALCDTGELPRVESTVRDAFAFAGLRSPTFRRVRPAAGARILRPDPKQIAAAG